MHPDACGKGQERNGRNQEQLQVADPGFTHLEFGHRRRCENQQTGAHDHGRERPTIQSQARLVGMRGTWDGMQHDVSLEVPWMMVGGLDLVEGRPDVVALLNARNAP